MIEYKREKSNECKKLGSATASGREEWGLAVAKPDEPNKARRDCIRGHDNRASEREFFPPLALLLFFLPLPLFLFLFLFLPSPLPPFHHSFPLSPIFSPPSSLPPIPSPPPSLPLTSPSLLPPF